jgi:hypothetical protein
MPEALAEVILRHNLHHDQRFSLCLFNALKTSPFQLKFYLWKRKIHRGRDLMSRKGERIAKLSRKE